MISYLLSALTSKDPCSFNSISHKIPFSATLSPYDSPSFFKCFYHLFIVPLFLMIQSVGFAVQQDLQKLSASYPYLLCFQRVMHVIDLAPLSKAAFPQVPILSFHLSIYLCMNY